MAMKFWRKSASLIVSNIGKADSYYIIVIHYSLYIVPLYRYVFKLSIPSNYSVLSSLALRSYPFVNRPLSAKYIAGATKNNLLSRLSFKKLKSLVPAENKGKDTKKKLLPKLGESESPQ